MRALKWVIAFCSLVLCSNGWSQSISINPATISPSSFNVITYTAGAKPLDLLPSYSGQKITYSFPYGNFLVSGGVLASVNNLPGGIKMSITAGSITKGTTTGLVQLSTQNQYIIRSIKNASNATSILTQTIAINDANFHLLKAGTETVTVNLYIDWYIF